MALRLRAARRPLLARRRRRGSSTRPSPTSSRGRRSRSRRRGSLLAWARLRRSPAASSATTAASRSPSRVLVVAVGVRGGRALRRARGLPPGRRDARDDHGRERLLRHHPGAPGARPREAGGARAGPAARAAREAALGAQQLPDAAGRLHDARRPLPAHVRAGPRVARPARDLRDRRRDPALLQPLARAAAAPGGSSAPRASGAVALAIVLAPDDVDATGGAERRRGAEHRRERCADLPLRRLGAARRPARERRADARSTRTRSRRMVALGRDAARERDRHDRRGAGAARRVGGRGAGRFCACSRSPRPGCASSPAGRTSWRRRRSPPSRRSCRSTTGSSTAAGAASRTGSPGATATSGSAPRTRPATRTRASSRSTRAAQSETELLFPYGYCSLREQGGAPLGEPLRHARRGPGAAEGARPADALGGRAADLVPRARLAVTAGRASEVRVHEVVLALHSQAGPLLHDRVRRAARRGSRRRSARRPGGARPSRREPVLTVSPTTVYATWPAPPTSRTTASPLFTPTRRRGQSGCSSASAATARCRASAAWAARSAWSGWSPRLLNVATIPSPMNFSTSRAVPAREQRRSRAPVGVQHRRDLGRMTTARRSS